MTTAFGWSPPVTWICQTEYKWLWKPRWYDWKLDFPAPATPPTTVFYTTQNARLDGKVGFPVPATPLTTVFLNFFYTNQNKRLDSQVDFPVPATHPTAVFYTKENTRLDGKVEFPIPATSFSIVFYIRIQNSMVDCPVPTKPFRTLFTLIRVQDLIVSRLSSASNASYNSILHQTEYKT